MSTPEPTAAISPDPSSSRTVLVGFVGTVILFVTVLVVEALYFTVQRAEIQEKIVNQVPEELTALRAKQVENLNTYRWIEKASGTLAIPIDRAMEMVAHEAASMPSPSQ
jgi:sensor domain CHASE-containing protein